MKITDLQKIYPFGQVQDYPADEKEFLSLEIQQQFFILPIERLNETEIKLLNAQFPRANQTKIDTSQHPWFAYLFENTPTPAEKGEYRTIQFQVSVPKSEKLDEEWLEAFSAIFENVCDCFLLTQSYGLLIERKTQNSYLPHEIASILQTLDSDFGTKTSIFMGNFFQNDASFPLLFKEEQQIFQSERPYSRGRQVLTLSAVALNYFTRDALSKSEIIATFRNNFPLDQEMQDIIRALWQNQGNISSAAKDLFMHRNTLQYRLDRFYETTNLSLKNFDDLIFCYLFIQ